MRVVLTARGPDWAYGEAIRYRDIPPEMPSRRHSRDMTMSLFGRKKPAAPVREYESWDPSVLAAAKSAPAEDGDTGAMPASGASRTGAQHLKAASDALDRAKARDAK